MKISIVTAYINRRELFIHTLKTIAKSKHTDFEFIVVDDGSDPAERLEDLILTFPFLKIIRLEKKDKWYMNPCIPFNLGIAQATGDAIILQNPECLHTTDILTYVNQHISDDVYLSFAAYATDELTSELVRRKINMLGFPIWFNMLPQKPFSKGMGWYNHSKFRPVGYHFCGAISKSNMNKLGGFDERYAPGYAFDDDELVCRIKRLGIEFRFVDKYPVIHQHHGKGYNPDPITLRRALERNKALFEQTKKEDTVKVFNRYATE
jgi:GT2 family glycosyltransferase